MAIRLPHDLESSLRAEVLTGRFATEDEAVAAIVQDYFHRKAVKPMETHGVPEANGGPGSIGAMRKDAELLDQAVEYAIQVRETRPWRLGPGE